MAHERPRGGKMDWQRFHERASGYHRGEAPTRLPPIIRKLIYRREFKPGSELCVYADNEERTDEAVLTRTGLKTRNKRVPKGATEKEILRILLG